MTKLTDLSIDEVMVDLPAPGVARITINRPELRNALNATVRAAMNRAFRAFDIDPEVRAVVMAGAGEHFAAGGDIREFGAASMVDRMGAEYTTEIRRCRKPVIAAVNGYALGGGCEYAMNCDIIIAGDDAQLGLPEVTLGLIPGAGGTQYLPRAIGRYAALQMLLTGQPIKARRAAELGLVSEVVEGRADDRALEIAVRIASLPPLAVQTIKTIVQTGVEAPLQTALAMERIAHQQMFATEDMREGTTAFAEKRKPVYQGR